MVISDELREKLIIATAGKVNIEAALRQLGKAFNKITDKNTIIFCDAIRCLKIKDGRQQKPFYRKNERW
jgi:hypothetical protein